MQPSFASSEPEWFTRSVEIVLDQADHLLTAGGPRELEQLTAELLGAELHRLAASDLLDVWIDVWFGRLVSAAATRCKRWADGAAVGRSAWWLLHGLAAVDTSPANAAAALDKVTAHVPHWLCGTEPAWLAGVPEIAATGDVWLARDGYGDRFAVIAAFVFPGDDSFVFLFDVNAAGLVELAGAGQYDDIDQAVRTWRSTVGVSARHERPHSLLDTAELRCLVQCDLTRRMPTGVESRATLDNWFRATRRYIDLADALHARGEELPGRHSLFDDIDPNPLVGEFADWYEDRHGDPVDLAAVDALAVEWLEGSLPETAHAISPDRVAFKRALLDDWIADDSITVAAKDLFPDWVRWLGLRTGLAEPLITSAVAVAARPWRR
jgi:hypothetical protein